MPRYINDDATIIPGIRTADKITCDQLKQFMITEYNKTVSVQKQNSPFNNTNYSSESQALEDLMAVLSYENAQIIQDLSNIDFDLENLIVGNQRLQWYAGDTGSNLRGLNILPSGLCFCGAVAGGDWEHPLFYIIYHDKTQNALRAYVPIKGNVVNCDTLSAFGSETNLCNPNLPYNLVQLYTMYKNKNLLVPSNATLSEFMDNDAMVGNSYLKQYGGLQLSGAIPGNPISANDGGFNWDAIAEELMDAITVQ